MGQILVTTRYMYKGYVRAPQGVYFNGDFSITAWIKIKSYSSLARIIEFGDGRSKNNILFLMHDTTASLRAEIYSDEGYSVIILSNLILLNNWYHVAFTFNNGIGSIYVNGVLDKTGRLSKPNNVIRKNCFIGKTNWDDVSPTDAVYSDVKIYKGSLTGAEIMNQYKADLIQPTSTSKTTTTSSNKASESYTTWIYYLIFGLIWLFAVLAVTAFKMCSKKRINNVDINATFSADNLTATNHSGVAFQSAGRQISLSESLYDYENALNNSVKIQEKEVSTDCKLPTYDEYTKRLF